MQGFTRPAVLAAAALAIFAFGGAAPAKADGLPFCVDNNSRGGMGRQCIFYTFQQCVNYRSGIGGSCFANPWYQPYYEPEPRRKRARRYHRD